MNKSITITSRYCLAPEWKAVFETIENGKKIKFMVCGKLPQDTKKEVSVYVVNNPIYKGHVDTLSLAEYTLLAMEKESSFQRENGVANYSEFSLI